MKRRERGERRPVISEGCEEDDPLWFKVVLRALSIFSK